MSDNAAAGAMSIAEALARANGHWNAGQADQAEQLCQRILAAWPGQADALHLLGLMAHAYGNLHLAISHLRQACTAPRAPAIYSSNLAEMYRQKGMLAEGEEAARRAVAMDPTLVSGWNNLGILLQEAGRFEESLACLEQVIALNPSWADAHNNLANTLRRLDRFDEAARHYSQALSLNPDYAEAHSNLSFLLSAQGRFDEAADAAYRAIELHPRLIDAYLNLAEVEVARHRYGAALSALDGLLAFAPQHPAALVARAKVLKRLERTGEALEYARKAVAIAPRSADAHHALANMLQAMGQTDEALARFEEAATLPGTVAEDALLGRALLLLEAGHKDEAMAAFDRAREAFPASGRALVSRVDAKKFKPGDPDIDAMEAMLEQGGTRSHGDRTATHFALGKAYLDVGDAQRAFAHLAEANRLKRATFTYDSASNKRWMQRIAGTFTPGLLESLQDAGEPSALPVFVLGMPRSGTTLVEQILSSHSQVTGAGELSALRLIVEENGGFPDLMDTLTRDGAARLGREYLARVTPLAQGRARVIDKMPGNFVYAGLIALILPGARIIHCRRDPVDTCLSCYTKQFGGDLHFTYDLAELGEFYRSYDALMEHWRRVLPADRFIEVDYESVVDGLDGEARRLVEFLGLTWEDACLNFHENRRVVRTASVNQVRQPLYRTSKGRWKQYADHLAPLLAALGIDAP